MNPKSGQLQIILSFFALASALMAGLAAADSINGRVLGGGEPIAGSTVTLWSATAGAPAQLGQAKTDSNGQFSLSAPAAPDEGVSTRCGGHGLVVFYGMAKPVRAPQIGPARPY